MPTISPFTPQSAAGVSLTASVASANVALPTGGGQQIRLLNTGSNIAYVAFGTSTVTASVASSTYDMVLPGSMAVAEKVTVDIVGKLTYMAAAASVANTLPIFIAKGEGF